MKGQSVPLFASILSACISGAFVLVVGVWLGSGPFLGVSVVVFLAATCFLTSVLTETDDRFAQANGDKPHRCPECHCIPEGAYRHGHARWFSVYVCEQCNVRWTRAWNDWSLRDRIRLRRLLRKY